jgi:hypothetical protein
VLCGKGKLTADVEAQVCTHDATAPEAAPSQTEVAQTAVPVPVPKPAINLAQLVGKRVKALRMPLCQPSTYTTDITYAGKEAKVLSAVKQTMIPPFSPTTLSRLQPEMRALLEDSYAAVTLLLQFDDGTKLDSCAPIGPSKIENYVELLSVPDQTPAPEVAPPTLTLEQQAKQAQQYADCLKAAVGNPQIVCKQ